MNRVSLGRGPAATAAEEERAANRRSLERVIAWVRSQPDLSPGGVPCPFAVQAALELRRETGGRVTRRMLIERRAWWLARPELRRNG